MSRLPIALPRFAGAALASLSCLPCPYYIRYRMQCKASYKKFPRFFPAAQKPQEKPRLTGIFFGGRLPRVMATATDQIETVTILEASAFAGGVRVDRDKGVIAGVKILGTESKNGRVYPLPVIRRAAALYEGARVNVNHPERDPLQPRTYEDRLGQVRNVHVRESGLFGDFHFNPKHRLAEQLAWDAEHAPENLGFSHNASVKFARGTERGKRIVESIAGVRSVDLVADPATTQSLFESETPMDPAATDPVANAASSGDPLEMVIDSIAQKISEIAKSEGDSKAKAKAIADLLKKQDKIMSLLGDKPAEDKGDEGDPPATSQEHVALKAQIDKLTQTLEQYEDRERKRQLTEAITVELKEAGLDRTNPLHVSDLFARQLLECESKDQRAALIKDRAAVIKLAPRSGRPQSGSAVTEGVGELTAEDFVRRIRS